LKGQCIGSSVAGTCQGPVGAVWMMGRREEWAAFLGLLLAAAGQVCISFYWPFPSYCPGARGNAVMC